MFLDLLRQRRSVRRFSDRAVETENVSLLLEAALRSPSSRGLNPWSFVIVDDRSLLQKLAKAKPHGASFLAEAPLGIVVVADPERCDVWIEDTAIATILVQLAAESIGLGSCWIQIRKRRHGDGGDAGDWVKQILDIPQHLEVESMIAVGYPDHKPPPHSADSLLKDRVHVNRYGSAPEWY